MKKMKFGVLKTDEYFDPKFGWSIKILVTTHLR